MQELDEIDWESYVHFLEKALELQIAGTESYFLIADRNTAGLTENSLRVRGYEKWYMDTLVDPLVSSNCLIEWLRIRSDTGTW